MQLRRLLFSQTVSIVVWSICVQNCWSWRRCCAKLDSTVMMRSMRYTMGPAWSTLWASNLYSPTMPLTVNDNPDGEVGVRLSACSAGNVMGTGDTPDFAEDSAIGYILGVAWWGPCSTVREGCEGGGEGRGPGGVCRTGACPGNGENAGVARGTNGAAAHGEDSDTIGCDGRYATVAPNGGPLAASLLAWSSISRKSLLNTKEEMSCSRIVSTFSAWCVMTNDV